MGQLIIQPGLRIANQYNSYTPIVYTTMASELSENETICNYELINIPLFKPGENSTVEFTITNPTSEDKKQ
jgi:hypothetical protein